MRERHVREDGLLIHFCHEGDFTKIALPLAVLILQDVALALFTAQHLTRRSNFESFGDGFSCFGYTSVFGHRGGESGGDPSIGKVFLAAFRLRGQVFQPLRCEAGGKRSLRN
jgi:hypothetical protein